MFLSECMCVGGVCVCVLPRTCWLCKKDTSDLSTFHNNIEQLTMMQRWLGRLPRPPAFIYATEDILLFMLIASL